MTPRASACVHTGEVKGTCRAISGRPGQLGKRVRFDSGASHCSSFEHLAYVHTDTAQIQDLHIRTLGGYEKVNTERLVYEKHER